MKTILLTIKKEFFEKIVSGEKTIELRKSRFKNDEKTTPVLLHVSGEKGVQGICFCKGFTPIEATTTKEQWEQFKQATQVNYDLFKSYTGKSKRIFGWQVSNAKRFPQAVHVDCRAGQSWRYFETKDNLGENHVCEKNS